MEPNESLQMPDEEGERLAQSSVPSFPDFEVCTSHPPIFQGAEARLYLCSHEGRQGVLKQRFPKQYRHPTLDSSLTKERVKAELRAAKKCQEANVPVPPIYHADVKGAKSDVVYAYVGQGLTAKRHIEEQRVQLAPTDFEAFIGDFGRKLGCVLARLHHSANLIHGDLTTSNVMVDLYGEPHKPDGDDSYSLLLIDFGLSFTSQQPEDRAVDLYVLERAIKTTHSGVEKGLVEATLRAYRQAADEVKGASEKEPTTVDSPTPQWTPKQIKQREQSGPDAVLRKLAEVRRRGRKRDMVG